jgi:hypothetical protein
VEIERLGGVVEVQQGRAQWFGWLVDPRYFERVVKVNLLNLERCDLGKVAVFDELESLVLYNVPLTERDLESLLTFHRLKELNLLYSSLRGEQLAYLARLPSLVDLRLSPLSDADAVYLAGCENLRTLRIYRSPGLTDKGLQQLARLPRLAELHLIDTGTTLEGVRAVRERLPSLEIVHQ